MLELNQRINNISEILDVTSKPLIMDADTGGKIEHFQINIKSIERMGVSAVIIEDKKGLKKFSSRNQNKTRARKYKNFFK